MNGLPALASNLASYGRNGDSMLVHMTPGEVNGLQALAMAHGGSLSVNPDTGLVEANFLKRLLPTLAGAALMIGSGGAINPMTAGMIVGGVEGLRTGDLGKGFMAGLGAYGGAGLGAGLTAAGSQAAAANAAQTVAAQPAASYAGGNLAGTVAPTVSQNFAQAGRGFSALGTEAGRSNFLGQAATATTPATGVGGLGGLAKAGFATAAPLMVQEPMAMPGPATEESNYAGPYTPSERRVRYPTEEERRRLGTGEFTYFTPSNPIPFAEGGAVTPAQAEVLQNIANVQQMAGVPVTDAALLGALPTRSVNTERAGLVYNPIPNNRTELVYNPVSYRGLSIPAREQGYGFKPVEVVGMPDTSGLTRSGGVFSGLGDKLGINDIPLDYTYDPATQTLRPSQKYLDAVAARRKQIADEEAAAAAATAVYDYGGGGGWGDGGFKEGGSVPTLEEGGFVLTKKAVDGLGKGNNKKGQKVARAGLGAIPIKGKGTGTSDSIPTTIAGRQPALVSNGEAYVPARKVKENGGAKAFYALMRRAEKAA